MSKKTNIENKLKEFYEIIKNIYPIELLFLYGSYAKGLATSDSDIDVGIVLKTSDHSKRIEIGANLFRIASQVDIKIEPKCIFMDEYKNPSKGTILWEILNTGKRIL